MAKRKACSWNIDLQTALVPLYLVSKLCCLNAFTYLPLKKYILHGAVNSIGNASSDCSSKRTANGKTLAFSIVGLLHAAGCSLAYASYHIVSSLSQSSKLTDSNLVRVAIDLKNQYVGCILVLVLVTVSFIRQPALNRLIQVLLRIDQLLPRVTGAAVESNLKPAGVNNAVWLRNVLLMLVLGVGVKATLEITNCLMYIRDSGSPFASNCLLLCIVPQTLCVISELQFVAYALLIRDRLRLINRWLLQLQPHLARGSESAFESAHHLAHIHGKLVNAVGLLNRCFGVQNAILLLFQFVTLVELGYNTCMMSVRYAEAHTQQGDSTEDFLETVYWIVWFVMEMFAVCYFSHATVEEFRDSLKLRLLDLQFTQFYKTIFISLKAQQTAHLLRPPNTYRMSVRSHFRLISQQQLLLLNLKTCITCGGLFTVDLTLLYAIIGATTTYLIILIQFDQSFNGD